MSAAYVFSKLGFCRPRELFFSSNSKVAYVFCKELSSQGLRWFLPPYGRERFGFTDLQGERLLKCDHVITSAVGASGFSSSLRVQRT